MLRSIHNLKDFKVKAKDGNLGKIKDFVFDDYSWKIRYLVADTGSWFGREVLLSLSSIEKIDQEDQSIHINILKEQVKKSPSVDIKTIEIDQETKLADYYGWPAYWEQFSEDYHLFSFKKVIGFNLETPEGNSGLVEDFIVDEQEWIMRYMILDLGGKKILLAVDWVDNIDEMERSVLVDVSMHSIQIAPKYNPEKPINRIVETDVFDHYKKSYYWGEKNETHA